MSEFEDEALRLPYPGLRSFQREESDLFFGREGSVNDMINRLRPHHFLAVLGTSGSGKSSLVRIGLLDGLELGLLAEAGTHWRIADFTPGANPMRNLARELVRLSGGEEIDVDFVEAMLGHGPRSVVEWCEGNLPPNANLLLLVDQFEELFRYQGYAQRQAAEAFVSLLIESARSRDVPIYVVITMRTDFLGACALIHGLAEVINDGQYLTPRLTREQCREAIIGPASVCGTQIEEPLVNRLLNDLEDFAPWDDRDVADQLDRLVRRADQLPLLQHTLNRLWLRADAERAGEDDAIVLRLADYEAIGGLRGAIDAHAEEILAGLGADCERPAELVFRALTDGKSLATAVRRPTPLKDLIDVCGGDAQGVRAVVEAFRAPGVNFLRPDRTVPLENDTIVDISHESLIRQWRRLSTWLQAEARKAQEWTRLGEAAARYREGKGARYHGQDLHVWYEHARPTEAWARRYNQPYEETLAFLDESMRAERSQTRWRRFITVATFVIVVVFGGGGFLLWQLLSSNQNLTASQQQLEAKNAELAALTDTVQQQAAAAVEARDQLDALVAEASDVFRNSIDSNIGEYQHGGNWSAAGALLGALLKEVSSGMGEERAYDPSILSAVRLRLAEQWAFAFLGSESGGGLPLRSDGDGRFRLSLASESGMGPGARVRLVDSLTGIVVAETVPEFTLEMEAVHYVSPAGDVAILVDQEGRAHRWRVGDDVVERIGALGAPGHEVKALAYDAGRGRIAAMLHSPDSTLSVIQDRKPYSLFEYRLGDQRALGSISLSGVAGADTQMDGRTVAFWNGNLLIGVGVPGNPTVFHASVDLDNEDVQLLPLNLEGAKVSSDGRYVFAVAMDGCAYDGDLAGRAGSLLPQTFDMACLGVFREIGSQMQPVGALRAMDGARAVGAMALSAVEAIDGENGNTYRVVLDDGADAPPGGAPARIALDVTVTADEVTALALDEVRARDDRRPLVSAMHAEATGFVRAYEQAPWSAMAAVGVPVHLDVTDEALAGLSADGEYVDERPSGEKPSAGRPEDAETRPVLMTLTPVADTEDGTVRALEIMRGQGEWYADLLGDYRSMVAARNDVATLVVARDSAALWRNDEAGDEARYLTPVHVDETCDFGDEGLIVSRLHAWGDTSPVFFGLSSRGRVLRIEERPVSPASSRDGAGTALGPTQRPDAPPAADGDGPVISISCVGQVRADPLPLIIPHPDGERLLVQTEEQAFRAVPPSVANASAFGLSPKIPLQEVPLLAVAVNAGSEVRIVSVDAAGYISLQQAARPWQAIGAARTVVVPDPVELVASGDRVLVVGRYGEAIVLDVSGAEPVPVAAGRVPRDTTLYWLEDDGLTVGTIIAGQIWKSPVPELPPVERLGRYAEGTSASIADPTDRALVTLGRSLVSGKAHGVGQVGELALDDAARCYLAADAVVAAWEVEDEEEGVESARLAGAREALSVLCRGQDGVSLVGRSLSTAPRYLSSDAPWPEEWSVLLRAAVAGDRLAQRAVAVGLRAGSDRLAHAAGAWFEQSDDFAGVVLPAGLRENAAAALDMDEDLAGMLAAARNSYDPAVHEIFGHIASGTGADMAGIREAWVHYRIAEILYGEQFGRAEDAARVAARRASLARAMPADDLLASWEDAARWTGEVAPVDIDALSGDAAPDERMAADAAVLSGSGVPESYRLLAAYLWTALAEMKPGDGAAEAYAAAAAAVSGLPPFDEVDDVTAGALQLGFARLEPAASHGAAMTGDVSARFAALLVDIIERREVLNWDADALAGYRAGLEAAARLWPEDFSTVPDEALARVRFSSDRFRNLPDGAGVESRTELETALNARLSLQDRLLARDDARADWFAARGATHFWLAVRIHGDDRAARDARLRLAIDDLAKAHEMAGEGALELNYMYWLAEARRWLTNDDSDAYVALVEPGIAEYETLIGAYEDWENPVVGTAANLIAAQAELYGQIADARSKALLQLDDDLPLDDDETARRYLEALHYTAKWDQKRLAAIEQGSLWNSTNAGFSYGAGYVVGSLAGRVSLNAGVSEPAACERLAAFAGDARRRAPGVPLDAIDVARARDACRLEGDAETDGGRADYHLGRVLWSDEAVRNGPAFDALMRSAEAGYGAAFNNLAGYAEDLPATFADADAWNYDLRRGYVQRTVIDGFSAVHAYLAARAKTDDELAAVRWLAEAGAELGIADAHVILADLEGSNPRNEERGFHLEIAARLISREDPERAAELRALIAPEIYVDVSDRTDDGWTADRLRGVPPEFVAAVRAPR